MLQLTLRLSMNFWQWNDYTPALDKSEKWTSWRLKLLKVLGIYNYKVGQVKLFLNLKMPCYHWYLPIMLLTWI